MPQVKKHMEDSRMVRDCLSSSKGWWRARHVE